MGELEPRRRDRETEGTSYVEVALGLVFVLAAVALFSTGFSSGVFFFGIPLLLPAAWLLGRALQDLTGRRRTLAPSVGKERELLSAIRDNGGAATAVEATMATSLGVKEAERMLSELAAGGHLRVELEGGGTLAYALPMRRDPEIDG
jgi:hypothetical protein